jgi:hypothetical protein
MTPIDKLNTLTLETTQALWDSADLARKQNSEFVQQWLGAFEANQAASRELSNKLFAHAQEAQKLWLKLAQETYHANLDVFTKLAQGQIKEATERVQTFARQANGAAKKTEATPASK